MNSSLREAGRPRAGVDPASGAASLIPEGLDATLVLLRHGQTEFIVEKKFQGQTETPLTKLGERQARAAGRRLAHPLAKPPLPIPDEEPLAIVHSPLGRTRQTAEAARAAFEAAGRTPPPLRPDPGFLEIAQGGWEGLTDDEIEARFGDSLAGWRRWPDRVHAPGGESLAQVRARVEASLSSILAELASGAPKGTHDRHQVLGYADAPTFSRRWCLIVGHGGVFRVALCALLGLGNEHFWNFDFGLAAISIVELRAGRAVLRASNLEDHLGLASSDEEGAERDATGAL